MAPASVAYALERAAQRSRRRVDLEVAKHIIQQSVGYEIAEEQFEWMSVLSHVLIH